MNLKRLGASGAVAMALSAILASGAFATVSTTRAEWYTGSTSTTLSGTVGVSETIGTHPVIGSKFSFEFEFGTRFRLTATGLSCVNCTIQNKEVTSKAGAIAYGEGKVKFTGVTVDEPANCKVKSETGEEGVIITKQLSIHGDWMDTATANQHAFVQFMPPSGTTTFAQFGFTGAGCEAIEGAKNFTGTLFGESKNNTGVSATTQELVFSPEIQTTTGAKLSAGSSAANLTGTGKFTLTSGAAFSIKP